MDMYCTAENIAVCVPVPVILLHRGNPALLEMCIHGLAWPTPLTEHIHHHQASSVDQLLPLLLRGHRHQAVLQVKLCQCLVCAAGLTILLGWASFPLSSSLVTSSPVIATPSLSSSIVMAVPAQWDSLLTTATT